MSTKRDKREEGAYLRLMEAGTELTEVMQRTQHVKTYRLDSHDTGFAYISWSPCKRNARNKIAVSEVQAVKKGKASEDFKHLSAVSEDLCFSIIYTSETNDETKTLSIIAPTQRVAEAWIKGLDALLRIKDTQVEAGVRKGWLEHIFEAADRNGDDTLDCKEVIKMAKELNMGFTKKDIQNMFEKAHKGGGSKQALNFDEFLALYEMMAQRPEINKLFEKYSSNKNKWLSPAGLLHFLGVEQGWEHATLDYCQDIISKYEPTREGKSLCLMSIDGFRIFLLSSECSIFKAKYEMLYQDMTRPLSHYYIACSHNTYLTGNQLNGESSTTAYEDALKSGCRSVELDSWDGEEGEPVIYHGHTLTSKILFRDALKAIRDTAFLTSQYPVILSLENHCSIHQQDKMADYLMDVLGNMLYMEARDESRSLLPSPEDLKGKILIKNKKLQNESSGEDGHIIVYEEEENSHLQEKRESDPTTRRSKDHIHHLVEKKVKLSVKLSKCVNYIESVQFPGFETKGPCYHNSSFSEHSVYKHAEHNGVQFVRYNVTQLSRIYPAGTRVDSSNYDPVKAWNVGCQLVALNYQTSGKSMDLNMAKFQQNGKCGYVLKPEVMREEISSFDPHQKRGFVGVTPKALKIHLLSAQNLPKPEGASKNSEIIDPYVIIHLIGVDADCCNVHSRTIQDNGFNPFWDEQFSFVVSFPELAFVRFVVMDADPGKDDFIGQYTLPFECLEQGYHHIHLTTTKGKPLPQASIFVYIEIQDKSEGQRPLYEVPEVRIPVIDIELQRARDLVPKALSLCGDYLSALGDFKKSCGLKPQSTFRESVALFSTLVESQALILLSDTVNDSQVFKLSSSSNSSITPMMDSFNKLNLALRKVLEEAGNFGTELDKVYQNTTNKKSIDKLTERIEQALPELKNQIHENYCAAVHTVRAVIKHLDETKGAAIDTANKILQAIEANGMDDSSTVYRVTTV